MRIASKIKKLFGRSGVEATVKASQTGALAVQVDSNQPKFTPRRYDCLAEEGFVRNVIAYRCIKMISQNAASIPLIISKKIGNKTEHLSDHPLVDLLAHPNPSQSKSEFIEVACGFLLIAGNSYIEAVGPDDTHPYELWALRPDRIQVIPGKNGLPKAYRYSVQGQKIDFPVDVTDGASSILHMKSFHPTNDWYGLSPMEAAAYSIDQHNEAAKWNTALLQNAGRPSGALVYNPADSHTIGLTQEQRAQLKSELETYYQGGANAGRPLVLEGGLDWREMSMSPKDMDWKAGKDMAAREIALAFNVPPQLVGIDGSLTYANFEQARLALYDDAVLPLMDHICNELNSWLCPKFGEGLSISIDKNAIEALSPRREKMWKRIQNSEFMTINEKRKVLGLSELNDDQLSGLRRSHDA